MILSTLTFLSLYGCQDNFVKDGPSIGDSTETMIWRVVDENSNSVTLQIATGMAMATLKMMAIVMMIIPMPIPEWKKSIMTTWMRTVMD